MIKKLTPYLIYFSLLAILLIQYLLDRGNLSGDGKGLIFWFFGASVGYFFLSKKYKPLLAWLLCFAWPMTYSVMLVGFIIMKLFKSSSKNDSASSSAYKNASRDLNTMPPEASGLMLGAEADVARLESEIRTYQEKYDEAMASPSAADKEQAAKVYAPMVEERKKALKLSQETLNLHRSHQKK